jgi:hypothetical protein
MSNQFQSLYKRIQDAFAEVTGAAPLPTTTPEQIAHTFVPHQTIQERNIGARHCYGWNIVWLRTCYAPSFTQKYLELERSAGARADMGCLTDPNNVLDDLTRYAFTGTDQQILDQLLLRIPGLTDAKGVLDEYGDGSFLAYGSGKNDPDEIIRVEGDELRTVALGIQNFVYVVDEEAVEKGIIKVWWFDEFGKIVWDNITTVDADLSGILGGFMDGQGFVDVVGEESGRGDVIVR